MSDLNEARRLAMKIDEQVQLLAPQGVVLGTHFVDRMAGYLPDLQKIWAATSDEELIKLCSEFPAFYRYAFIMEQTTQAQIHKGSRP